MMKTLCESISYFHVRHQASKRYNCASRVDDKMLLPRRWVYHEACPFHLRRLTFPYQHNITHIEFLQYVKSIQPIWSAHDVKPVESDGFLSINIRGTESLVADLGRFMDDRTRADYKRQLKRAQEEQAKSKEESKESQQQEREESEKSGKGSTEEKAQQDRAET
ncbi:hypothetical protein KR222_006677 [Zaprionus bogoriensis]|nr:hypothetical protein KR222_006677 [Zaprionus bogoriensis]